MDKITIDRIATLHPKIRQTVLDAYTHVNQKLLGKGVRLRFAYTTRTNEEQAFLYSFGRTRLYTENGRRINKVTNANAGQSIHNYSLAFDIVLMLDKDRNGSFESAAWDTKIDFDGDGKADWLEVADYFKSIGFVWGGDWKGFNDPPHFEMTFGHTWRTLQKLPTFTETINGKVYTYPKL